MKQVNECKDRNCGDFKERRKRDMGFTEEMFLFIFMPFSIVIYLIVNKFNNIKFNNIVLVIMNLMFYAWSDFDTLLLFVLLNVFVFILGNLIYLSKNLENATGIKKKWTRFSVIIFIMILFYYKYVPFIFQVINNRIESQFTLNNLIVPIGISFVIFEAISYVVDIFRGGQSQEHY